MERAFRFARSPPAGLFQGRAPRPLLLAKLRVQRRVALHSILRLLGTRERWAKSTVLGTFALSMSFINAATERILPWWSSTAQSRCRCINDQNGAERRRFSSLIQQRNASIFVLLPRTRVTRIKCDGLSSSPLCALRSRWKLMSRYWALSVT